MNRAIEKLTSGRFLLTTSVALLLLYHGVTNPASFTDMKEIVLVVIYAYFNRAHEAKKEEPK